MGGASSPDSEPCAAMLFNNIDDGYLEGLLRGYRAGILTDSDYVNLRQCESIDDMKMHLASTDYGNFLQNEPSPISASLPVTYEESCIGGCGQLCVWCCTSSLQGFRRNS